MTNYIRSFPNVGRLMAAMNLQTEDYCSHLPEKPKQIDIETINRCNGECEFCPGNKHYDKRKLHIMTDETFNRVLQVMRNWKFTGHVNLYGLNEPFLDPKILDRLDTLATEFQDCDIMITSNTQLLTEEKLKKIISYSNVKIYLDFYQMECTYPPDKEWIKEYERNKQVIIDFTEPNKIRFNRACNAPNNKEPYSVPCKCFLPFHEMEVLSDGKINLCCNDYKNIYILGNIWDDEPWKTPERLKLWKLIENCKSRRDIKLCNVCDNIPDFAIEDKFISLAEENDIFIDLL